LVVADLGADLAFELPEGRAQGVASVVVDGHDGLREQVADDGDGGVGGQVAVQPVGAGRLKCGGWGFPRLVVWPPVRVSALAVSALAWSGSPSCSPT
jgi:hypothetical protein